MLGAETGTERVAEGAISGTLPRVRQLDPGLLPEGRFLGMDIGSRPPPAVRHVVIAGESNRGVIRHVCALRKFGGRADGVADQKDAPYAPLRWVNEWNNIDVHRTRIWRTSISLGRGTFVRLSRVNDYGRLLASPGSTESRT
jgi:alpha-glucuronidase